MLGDWSITLFLKQRIYVDYQLHTSWLCIQLRGDFNLLDLATRFILRLPASSRTTSVRCM